MSEPGDGSFVRDEDLLEDPVSTERGARGGLGWRRQLTGLGLAIVALPLLTLLLRHTRDSLALDGQVLLSLLAVVIVALVGGAAPAVVAAIASVMAISYYFV